MTAIWNPALGYFTHDVMVDIDDVIVPWYETIDTRMVAAWGPRVLDLRPWSMWEDWPDRTREEWEEIVVAAKLDGLYTTVEPLPYSVAAVNRLRWYGHRVHIVTARGFMADGKQIKLWTRQYLEDFAVGHDTLTFAKDKVEAMEALEVTFDWAIDDGVHNYQHLDAAGVPVWLQDAPHNRAFETERRTTSLWAFADMVLRETTPLSTRKALPA